MIKEIKIILEKEIPTGGLRFTVVEMAPTEGGFSKESPIPNVTISILKDGCQVFRGWSNENGVYQETGLPLGLYDFNVTLDGYKTKVGVATVE